MLTAKFIQHRPIVKIEVWGEQNEVDEWISSFRSIFLDYNVRILGACMTTDNRIMAIVQRNRNASSSLL